MEIVFIRHGEPDYAPCDERGFIGHGRSLAPLSELGAAQAERAALDRNLAQSEIIVSSPYPRALQTAAILSCITGIRLTVEMDLREWEPDKSYQFRSSEEADALYQDFCNCRGIYPDHQTRKWEEISELIYRIRRAIDSYYNKGYKKIIVVSHGGVIRRFTGEVNVKYCTPYVINYNDNFECFLWVC